MSRPVPGGFFEDPFGDTAESDGHTQPSGTDSASTPVPESADGAEPTATHDQERADLPARKTELASILAELAESERWAQSVRWAQDRLARRQVAEPHELPRAILAWAHHFLAPGTVLRRPVGDVPGLVDALVDHMTWELLDRASTAADGSVSIDSLLYAFLDRAATAREGQDPRRQVMGMGAEATWHALSQQEDPWALIGRPEGVEMPSSHATGQEGEVPLPQAQQPRGLPLGEVRAELDGMIGLTQVKQAITTECERQELLAERARRGLPDIGASRHLVFAGNPGTGKTTVARLVGEMYAASGVLERGQLVEMGPDSFLGRWQGGNTERIGRAVKAALGGVLLIDEAYSLNSRAGAPMEFAQQVIDSLVKALEDHRDNLVVIFTGYPEEMEGFLDTNPGLRSRIGPVIRFPDYTPEELVLVLLRMADAAEVLLSEGVTEAFRAHVAGLPGHRAKGNARYVRNVFEDAIGNLAIRLADEDLTQLPDSDLSTLLVEDLRHALARIPDAAPRHRRIGFTMP